MPIVKNAASAEPGLQQGSNYKHSSLRSVLSAPVVAAPHRAVKEFDVELALQKSMQLNQTMKVFLISLRDDLRNKGALVPAAAVASGEQVKKRKEVEDKLSQAYFRYKASIAAILKPVHAKKRKLEVPSESRKIADATPEVSQTSEENKESGLGGVACEVIELSEESDADERTDEAASNCCT